MDRVGNVSVAILMTAVVAKLDGIAHVQLAVSGRIDRLSYR